MSDAVVISGDLGFAIQQQGRELVIQCWECGEHTRMPVGPVGAAHQWQKAHKLSCAGDDEEAK